MLKANNLKKIMLAIVFAAVSCNSAQAIFSSWTENPDSYANHFYWAPEAIASGILTPFSMMKDAISGLLENSPVRFATALFGCVGMGWVYKKLVPKRNQSPTEIWFLQKPPKSNNKISLLNGSPTGHRDEQADMGITPLEFMPGNYSHKKRAMLARWAEDRAGNLGKRIDVTPLRFMITHYRTVKRAMLKKAYFRKKATEYATKAEEMSADLNRIIEQRKIEKDKNAEIRAKQEQHLDKRQKSVINRRDPKKETSPSRIAGF